VEDTLQDALKAQPNLLPLRKAAEEFSSTSYKKNWNTWSCPTNVYI